MLRRGALRDAMGLPWDSFWPILYQCNRSLFGLLHVMLLSYCNRFSSSYSSLLQQRLRQVTASGVRFSGLLRAF